MPEVDLTKLALAQALYKACADLVSTKGGPGRSPNLRTRADARLREMYESGGVDRVRLRVNGEEVGTLSVKTRKERRREYLCVTDQRAFEEGLRADADEDSMLSVALRDPKVVGAILDCALSEGCVPDGCETAELVEPGGYDGTAIRVDAGKVAEAYGSPERLNSAVAGLIGGGMDADEER